MNLDSFFHKIFSFFEPKKHNVEEYKIVNTNIHISDIPRSCYLVIKKYGLIIFLHKLINFIRFSFRKYFREIQNLYHSSILSYKTDGLSGLVFRSFNFLFYGKGVLSRDELIKRGILKKEKINTSITDIHSTLESFSRNGKEQIVIISHDATKTGAPLLALNITKTLKKNFNKEVIIVLIQGGPLEEEFKKYGLVIDLSHKSLASITQKEEIVVNDIFESLSKLGINKCIGNTVLSGTLLPIAKKYGFSVISLVHEQSKTIKDNNFTEATNSLLRYSDKLIFSSDFVKDDFSSNFQKFDKEVFVRPQGIYLQNTFYDEKETARKVLRRRLELEDNSKIILGAGFGNLRKGVDLFFEVANQVTKEKKELETYFVWMGEWDNSLRDKLLKKADTEGFLDRIILIGFESDPSIFFAGADLFLLTSRQDPFPSVVLNAMDCGIPVIAFDKAGGSPEILAGQQGVVVPYLNIDLMKKEVLCLLTNKELYKNISEHSKKAVREKFIFEDYVKFLLDQISGIRGISLSKTFSRKFKVSVIVPNYNYENFLTERLQSIINQTYKPFEIVFLDDNSQDNSIQLAEKILSTSRISYKIISNKVNQGCFSQWAKGVGEASGDLIWIAEADDSCELTFLESLVSKFEDPEVGLAYCQSARMNESSEKQETYLSCLETTAEHDNRWRTDYVNSGADEIRNYMVVKNTLFNASALIMRKDLLFKLKEDIGGGFKQAGDWYTYVKILQNSKIAFCAETLNYHRYHSKNIVSRSGQITDDKARQLVSESLDIQNMITSQFLISKKRLAQSFEHTKLVCRNNLRREIDTFPEYLSKISIFDEKKYFQKKRILFFSTNDNWGGSEVSCAGLARKFSQENYFVGLCMKKQHPQPEIIREISCEKQIALLERLDNGDYCKSSDVRAFINNFEPDLVFISQGHMFEGREMMLWCQSNGYDYVNFIPLITEQHVEIINPDKESLFENRKLLGESKMIFSDNRPAQKLLEKIFGRKFDNFLVIRNTFDVPYNQTPLWEEDTDGFFKLIFIGRLYFLHKGLDLLLEVLAMKKWKERHLQIIAFGEGSDRDAIEEYIESKNIRNFLLRGYTNDLKREIIKCHGIIFPSKMEGTPISLVDAMLCHRMAIITPVGGMTEFIKDGETGFVADAPTAEAIDSCMERAWERRYEWQKIGENAGREVRNLVPEFPHKQCVEIIDKILN